MSANAPLVGQGNRSIDSHTFYPETDGQPMAENEVQLFLMMALIAHLRAKLGGPDAHVGGDLFWYPVEGEPKVVQPPDVFVVFGRPQEPKRRSWKQWEENGQPPDLVIEVVLPSNSWADLARLLRWYEKHGVREYVVLDPERGQVMVFRRQDDDLVLVPSETVSELARLRFDPVDGRIEVTDLDLGRVLEPHEMRALVDVERSRADDAEVQVAKLEAKLRALGIDPDA
jgi:Uma2 family endonuclease